MSRASVGVVVTCPCGEVYELKPEYAGRLLECPVCASPPAGGPRPDTPRPPSPDTDPAFDRDVFLLRERVLTIASKYEVWAEDGTPILYVERPTYPSAPSPPISWRARRRWCSWARRRRRASGATAAPLCSATIPVATFIVR